MQLPSLLGHTQELLNIILHSQKPADVLIDTFFRGHKYLGSHDRKFIAETTYGTLRHLRKCELMVASALTELNEHIQEEDKIFLLVVAYMTMHGKTESILPEHISSKVKSSQLREQAGRILPAFGKPFISPDGSVIERIGVEYSFPDWMVERFVQQYGEVEAGKICSSLNEQAPLSLRVNTLKTTVEQCQIELRKQGVETSRTTLSPFGLTLTRRINVFSLPAFRDGWFEVQDEGSQLLPLLIDPKPNSKLLDVCAGAGGKTLEFSAVMKNRGEIFAADINTYRLEELRKRSKRAGAQNIRVLEIQTIDDLSEPYAGSFDIVFVDAPCSGLGTIRRNPGMKWMVTEQTVQEVSEKQKSILHSSVPLVKPGGRLVYATCTLLQQENEDVVEEFTKHHPEFLVVHAERLLENLPALRSGMTDPFFRLLPQNHGTDGFFCAVLEKQPAR